MKKRLLVSLLSWSLMATANDTLTRTQVYNFNIGDTFDYKYTYNADFSNIGNGGPVWNYYDFARYVIENKLYNVTSDTLFILRKEISKTPSSFDTLIIAKLDSFEIFLYPQNYSVSFVCDTNQKFNGHRQNEVTTSGLGWGSSHTFAEDLGLVFYRGGSGDGMGTYESERTELIYYSKPNEIFGTTYFEQAGINLLHFTPIPEECAIWTKEINQTFPTAKLIREQIKTGNKIPLNGHTFVELIYTGYDFQNHDNHIDSLIGYFRNDTLNKLVWFTSSLDSSESILYDFNLVNGARSGNSHITLSQVLVNGMLRTKWSNHDYFVPVRYIEGIGGLSGFINVKSALAYDGFSFHDDYGELVCFSVCGQTLYPNDTLADCPLVSGNDEIQHLQSAGVISPNPFSSQLNITTTTNKQTTLSLYNFLGQQVLQQSFTYTTTINSAQLANGIYFYELRNGQEVIGKGKVVKQ